jgi:hypothetical protein
VLNPSYGLADVRVKKVNNLPEWVSIVMAGLVPRLSGSIFAVQGARH